MLSWHGEIPPSEQALGRKDAVPIVVASSSDAMSMVGLLPAQRQNRMPFSMPPWPILFCTAAYTAL